MEAPHNPHDTMLARRICDQAPTFLPSGNATDENEVSTPTPTQVMHADTRAKYGSHEIDIDFFHRGFLVNIASRVKGVPGN